MFSTINRICAYALATLVSIGGGMTLIFSGSLLALPLVFLGPLLAVAIHECGHALAAHSAGMRVLEIAIGPMTFRFQPLRLSLGDELLGHDVGGHVLHDDSRGRYLTRSSDVFITAAGPLANLATAIACFVAGGWLTERGAAANLLGGFALLSFAAFILSAWPMRLASGQANDALALVRIFRDGRLARKRPASSNARSPWQAP
jgi:membrane-associated protease RseP (regulator of RpoE activity)